MVLFIGPLYSGKHEAAKAYDEAAALSVASDAAQYDIILYTEVGSGLVPVDEEERKAREAAGRLSIRLAEQADEVYRVVCGIAKKLK